MLQYEWFNQKLSQLQDGCKVKICEELQRMTKVSQLKGLKDIQQNEGFIKLYEKDNEMLRDDVRSKLQQDSMIARQIINESKRIESMRQFKRKNYEYQAANQYLSNIPQKVE